MLLDVAKCQLLIVDVQERLLPAMYRPEGVLAGCQLLLRAAAAMAVPIIVSRQYPRGLGATVPELAEWVPDGVEMDKVHFSCTGDDALMVKLAGNGRPQVVIGGIEAHICVMQTALDLAARDYQPCVVMDAVSSRRPESVELAQRRLSANGIEQVSAEMVLFEWLGQAGTPEFKELSVLVK
ncbi:MAG: isochorismatase family protein [Alphaproteobacteria bacterium]|jgi:nicotinamidase-related amidase|nr:isochorismatase family protein [Alphaproteobacteria bacterium]MDP6566137.1 isochorismatase family protein [Alphaproteobacteria bacterium]MDP6815224.1 isochorismatase family protein [Alphaproteobacteria bacterium]